MSFYSSQALLFIRALTPLHVGTGRLYVGHVDLPIQRDEFNYPTIWASSLKGAIKANIVNDTVRKCFGKDPDEAEIEAEYAQSHVVVTDARLLLIPARVLNGVYTFMSSLHLLNYLHQYLETIQKTKIDIDNEIRSKLEQGISIVSKQELLKNGKVIINETPLKAEFYSDLFDGIGLKGLLPNDIYDEISNRGLVIVPDKDNTSLNLVNKSLIIQYRVRLRRETKTVDEGPWSEEYLPSETVFVSLILRKITIKNKDKVEENKCDMETINKLLTETNTIFIGGKETIGKGLAKLYFKQ